jgi:hypothetical protein
MERQGDEVHLETDEARGASSPNIVRWVLAISLIAAIVLLSIVWMTGAATQGPAESEGTADGRERLLQEYGSRGGVLSSTADEIETPEAGDTAEPGTPPTVENEAAEPAPPPPPSAT